jgi:2-keto-4-pentenoate hydratase/2-oxohepta-3-ene-1,7-dioic acid hydratase in catechol pathway
MKIIHYKKGNHLFPAIITENGIYPIRDFESLNENNNSNFSLLIDCIKNLENLNLCEQDTLLNEEDLIIGPCVPNPQKIICIGLNYRKHAFESGMDIPTVPIIFTKYSNTLTDYGADVPLGQEGEQFDYEVELGVVIGKKCKNVSKEDALDYVFGYCVANDLSCRDLQFKTSQWLLGKSLDHFLPLGKYLVTANEVVDPQNLQLTCYLNGERRQNSNTVDMIFSVAEIIAFLSKYLTLEPGDLILTGTPEGVIMGLSEKKWLKPNDIVCVEIEKLGRSENKFV